MDEENRQNSESIDDRDKRETLEALDRADQVAERMARENARRERLLEREEALEARRRLGGRSEAGQEAPKEPEESASEYKDKFMRGIIKPK